MMLSAEIISAIAAVVSAVGGAFAAVAAFRSADSARKTEQAAEEMERRSALRQLVVTAKEVEVEGARCAVVSAAAIRSRRDLAIFSGGPGGSREKVDVEALAGKAERANAIEAEGKLFGAWPSSLAASPLEEIDRVATKLLALRTEVIAMRQDLEGQRSDFERQNDTYRQKVIQG